jgi:hypothetical protein
VDSRQKNTGSGITKTVRFKGAGLMPTASHTGI